MCRSLPRPAAATRRHPGLPLGAALALCIAGQTVQAASRPYLTVSQPMEMRQAPPRALAPRILTEPPAETTEVAPDVDETVKSTVESASDPGAGKIPETIATTPIVKPTLAAPEPPLELLPDSLAGPRPVMLEDFLPYFLPPGAPKSRATYEQK